MSRTDHLVAPTLRQVMLWVLAPGAVRLIAFFCIVVDFRRASAPSPAMPHKTWSPAGLATAAYLVRGESLCADGCARHQLENEGYKFYVPANGQAFVSHANGEKQRAVSFPACPDWNIHRFGLNMEGAVYFTYYETHLGIPKQCIVDPGPYHAVSLQNGRLQFH